MSTYTDTSANAFNYWVMIGKNQQSDTAAWAGLTFMQWGMLMFSLISIVSLLIFSINYSKNAKRNFFNLVLLAAIIYAASFDVLTRVHERHFLIALPFMAILAVLNKKFLIIYAASSAVYFLNLYYVYDLITFNSSGFFLPIVMKFLSGVNVLILILLVLLFIRQKEIFSDAKK